MGYELTGQSWDRQGFRGYVAGLPELPWVKAVCVHHTATPNLSQRPQGWKIQHMRNLQHFYQNELGWSAGPHLFTDEDQIFGLSSLYRRGVHARTYNPYAIGIEALGNYDSEDPLIGRGFEVWKMTATTASILLDHLGLEPNDKTVLFHRDDPKTSKTCPGSNVEKDWFLDLVVGEGDRAGKEEDTDQEISDEGLRSDLKGICAKYEIS